MLTTDYIETQRELEAELDMEAHGATMGFDLEAPDCTIHSICEAGSRVRQHEYG
jgi:hypothetical protein